MVGRLLLSSQFLRNVLFAGSSQRLAALLPYQSMKFFLPLATSEAQAERIHARIADRLKAMGYEITTHRIASVVHRREGRIIKDAVGYPADNDEIVLAIFKNEIGYFVCTYSQGAVWGHPVTIRYAMVESAEDFDQADFNQKGPE
ncbi:hypothetical protein [Spirosoma sp.]|uniref:hypothetical protein n=1 Tax=Spirosoma sp. TaxID=1899569 RepID=UPI003B3AFC18